MLLIKKLKIQLLQLNYSCVKLLYYLVNLASMNIDTGARHVFIFRMQIIVGAKKQ